MDVTAVGLEVWLTMVVWLAGPGQGKLECYKAESREILNSAALTSHNVTECAACTTTMSGPGLVSFGCLPKGSSCAQMALAEAWNRAEAARGCCTGPRCNAHLLARHRVLACFHGDPVAGYKGSLQHRDPTHGNSARHNLLANPLRLCSVCWGTSLGERGCDYGSLAALRAFYNTSAGVYAAGGAEMALCTASFCNVPPPDTRVQVPPALAKAPPGPHPPTRPGLLVALSISFALLLC